jgi:UDP:flavonoid glycosyltransferase YjiC (YdhE family)
VLSLHARVIAISSWFRAGVPTLILSTDLNQTLWGNRVKQLKVGFGRRFSSTSEESLVTDLRRILAPQYVARARGIATKMTKPVDSVVAAADLVENFARLRRIS